MMSGDMPLAIELKSPGKSPATLASDAAAVLKGNTRVEVEPTATGLTLRGVWESDIDHAIAELTETLGVEFEWDPPRILYREKPRLLEPVMQVRLSVPSDSVGKVVGDLTQRRASIQKVNERDDRDCRIDCLVPLANLFGYFSAMQRLTEGRGKVDVEFHTYQPVPPMGPEPDPGGAASAARRARRTG